jgi:hypothetical protein
MFPGSALLATNWTLTWLDLEVVLLSGLLFLHYYIIYIIYYILYIIYIIYICILCRYNILNLVVSNHVQPIHLAAGLKNVQAKMLNLHSWHRCDAPAWNSSV